MWYGWTGTELEVDLSRGSIKKSEGDREMYQTYLGGRGLSSKLFWDRVPPETAPFSPDNLLIFSAGVLVGTAAPLANRTNLVTRSPLTNYLTYSGMGGFWGPELKCAGYDTLIFSGKSPSPVYLYINNDRVEIRDASHLWGKGVFETQQMIRAELKNEKPQIMCIGPAGENKVFFASIEHGPGSSFSRAGVGAIVGDKKLKAIVVQGTKDVNLARPTLFYELCNEIQHRGKPGAADGHGVADHDTNTERGKNLYRNFELLVKTWKGQPQQYKDFLEKRGGVFVGCFNCFKPCIRASHLPDGYPVFMKCRSRHRFTTAADIQDYNFNLRCLALVQGYYGFDTLSSAAICVFAIDLYQKGILTKEDTDGMHLEWGNPEVVPALLEKIARREGIGDVLANGVYQAARQIGRGAEQYAYHTRKLEPRGRQMHGFSAAVKLILHDRQDTNLWGGANYEAWLKAPEESDWRYPQEWKKDLTPDVTKMDYNLMSKTIAYDAESGNLQDFIGLCTRVPIGSTKNSPIQDQAELVSYATGLKLDEEEARKCVRRVRALVRAYNAILGERIKASDLPAEWFLPRDYDKLSKTVEETNKVMGYNPEGIPTGEALEELGLGYVAQELERRGILPEPVAIPVV